MHLYMVMDSECCYKVSSHYENEINMISKYLRGFRNYYHPLCSWYRKATLFLDTFCDKFNVSLLFKNLQNTEI